MIGIHSDNIHDIDQITQDIKMSKTNFIMKYFIIYNNILVNLLKNYKKLSFRYSIIKNKL